MFEITLIAMGKLKEKFYLSAAAEYEKRLGGYCRFKLVELPEYRLPENPSPAEIAAGLSREAEAILAAVPRGAWLCVFTPEGKLLSSEEFAAKLSQVKTAPTGVDEQAGLLMTNPEGQMATVMLSLRSKQPKRGMVSCEKGYIEIMEYPRAWEAKITDTDSGNVEVIRAGDCAQALMYESSDMERAIAGEQECMCLSYTEDVMDMMTRFRKEWGVSYPEEE